MQIEINLQPLPTKVYVYEIPTPIDNFTDSVLLFPRQGIVIAIGECVMGINVGDKVRLPIFQQHEVEFTVEGNELIKIDYEYLSVIKE
jgi:hypothetical protein